MSDQNEPDMKRVLEQETELLDSSARCANCFHSELLHGWTGPQHMSQCLIEECDCEEMEG